MKIANREEMRALAKLPRRPKTKVIKRSLNSTATTNGETTTDIHQNPE